MRPSEIRNESWALTQDHLGPRQLEVLKLLRESQDGLTAWEASERLGRMIHALRPRITELQKMGLVKPMGAIYHSETQRRETVWVATSSTQFDEQGQGVMF